LAIFNNHFNSADILINSGAILDEITGKELLEYSIDNENYNCITLIINNGFSKVDEKLKYYMSNKCLNWYLNQSFTITNTESISIDLAISKGLINIVEKFIKNNDKIDNSLLFNCLVPNSKNHLQILELLLNTKQFDINFQNSTNETLIFRACQNGLIDFVKLLLKFNANPEIANDKGNNCLWIACVNGNLEIVSELLNNNVDPNKTNIKGNLLFHKKGDTCLIPCVQKGYEDIVLLLLSNGANIEYENKNGGFIIFLKKIRL
jgi:ankyrin repeat protein